MNILQLARTCIGSRWCVFVLASLASWAACSASAHSQSFTASANTNRESSSARSPNLTDQAIVTVIERRLERDDAVPSYRLSVTATNRVVTLAGSVDNLLARDRAIELAQATRGVQTVVDQIEVSPPRRTDAQIARDMKGVFLTNPVTENFRIDPQVHGGIVTLSGEVSSWQERRVAERMARSVRGVRRVENELQVRHDTSRLDQAIRADVQSRLRWDTQIRQAELKVTVDSGRVSLAGLVESAAAKQRAHDDAWVTGVQSVDVSAVSVVPDVRAVIRSPDRSLSATGYFSATNDTALKAALARAYTASPGITNSQPSTTIENGVITLTGAVTNLAIKQAAEEIARDLPGVTRVNNFLKVQPADAGSNDQIADQLRQSFARDSQLSPDQIGVDVDNGQAVLSGNVSSAGQRSRAGQLAAQVPGVAVVRNNLVVPGTNDNSPQFNGTDLGSDAEIQQNIWEQLAADPLLTPDQVSVTVRVGIATLTGTVDSWTARNAAREDALDGGAFSVLNRLVVSFNG